MSYKYDYAVLVISEPDFVHSCKDRTTYMQRLNKFLNQRAEDSELKVSSVSGKYGLEEFTEIEVDDKNKTAFMKSLVDHLNQFDEIVVIANFENDPFIEALNIRAGELSKTLTIYSYEKAQHEEQERYRK